MAQWPTTATGIRARIASYRRILRQEAASPNGFGDGYGKRFWLFHLYYLLRDEGDVRAYLDWYTATFPDDHGEVGQFLCWALILRRLGREDEALYRFVQAIDRNLPAIAQVVGDSQAPYGMWGEDVMAFRSVLSDITDAITADERGWLVASWKSSAVTAMRQGHIAIGRARVAVESLEERVSLSNGQQALVQAFKPRETQALSTGSPGQSWLMAGRPSTRTRPGRKMVQPTADEHVGGGGGSVEGVLADDAVTIVITGMLDYERIACLARNIDPAQNVILDLTAAAGGSSTHIAACIQVAIVTGRPVTVRGCNERFASALKQMRLGHLIRFQAKTASQRGRA